jgi:hypothetical protein
MIRFLLVTLLAPPTNLKVASQGRGTSDAGRRLCPEGTNSSHSCLPAVCTDISSKSLPFSSIVFGICRARNPKARGQEWHLVSCQKTSTMPPSTWRHRPTVGLGDTMEEADGRIADLERQIQKLKEDGQPTLEAERPLHLLRQSRAVMQQQADLLANDKT